MKVGRRVASAVAVALLLVAGGELGAQRVREVPPDLEGVGIDQKPDAQVPLDLVFQGEDGTVRLGDYFRPERPMILTLVYYRCPMLCGLVLNGLVDALRSLDELPGREFEIVTVSINPQETPELARAKKRSIIESYGRSEAAAGWHFLTGEAPEIERLAEAVGFRFRPLDESGEFAHAAAVFVLTPEGRVSRYLLGVDPEPRTLRLALVEASQGKIGSIVDQFLLYCYRYDAKEGRYTPMAWRIMRIGAALTVLTLGALVATFLYRESRQRQVLR